MVRRPAAAGLKGNGGPNAARRPSEKRCRIESALVSAASLVEHWDDAIVCKTLDGVITGWNAGAERLYGYSAREVIGRKSVGITTPETEAAIREGSILRCVASLAAAAAHEINNPLAVVVAYLDLMIDDADATERARIGEMVKAVSRIQDILIRMNGVSRIEMATQTRYLPEMLDLVRSSDPTHRP